MSIRNKRENVPETSRMEKLMQLRDDYLQLEKIMGHDLLALTREERAEVKQSLRNVRECFKPYMKELADLIEIEQRRQQEIEEICKRDGHAGKWKAETFYEDAVIDHQYVKNMPYTKWYRICTRCGKTEWTDTMPKELINEARRKEIKELQAKIKKIESELDGQNG